MSPADQKQLLQKRKYQLAEKVIRKCDRDADGFIDFQDFVMAAVNYDATLTKENIQIAFNMLDHNNDGQISEDDLKVALNVQKAPAAADAVAYTTNNNLATTNQINVSPYTAEIPYSNENAQKSNENEQGIRLLEEMITDNFPMVAKNKKNVKKMTVNLNDFDDAIMKYRLSLAQIETKLQK